MSMYKFDETGRLLKQWWKCERCKASFKGWIEVCPSCKSNGTPRNTPDYGEKKLVEWKEGWATVRSSPDHYCQLLVERIEDNANLSRT